MPQITIQGVNIDTVTKGRNSYQVATVVYTTGRGEQKEKKVMSFSNPAVFAAVSKATQGQVFDVVSGEAPYFNWASATLMGAGEAPKAATAAPGGGKATVSTYETADERKIKQLYIVKQSSIANALEYLKSTQPTGEYGVNDVINVAQEFVDFVYGTNETLSKGLEEMDSDL